MNEQDKPRAGRSDARPDGLASETKDSKQAKAGAPESIDRIGVAGPLGEGEQGRPLRQGRENRERVGAGGPVGES